VLTLADREGASADDLDIHRDVTSSFEGEDAVGLWTLRVSDNARRDVGRLLTWRIELDFAPAAPDPGDGNRVWADVQIPMETAHPYTNNEETTFDLRPYSGGASRARIVFERIDVERGYDVVEVLDADTGEVLDTFTGSHEELVTQEYDTGNLEVRLVSDYSITDWGFAVSAVQVFGLGCLEDSECGPGYQCPNETIRCFRYPCFVSCVEETRDGDVGDGCTGSGDCRDGLFCGTDGFCREVGSCGEVADCDQPGNEWIHILCVGRSTCDAGMCGWDCSGGEICVDGETRDDGCNTCTCSGGTWACTERACPELPGLGEACTAAVGCEEGFTCDLGRVEGEPACDPDRTGVCDSLAIRLCTRDYRPVCSCGGQTFSNDCMRTTVAPWAHDGECEFGRAIPDADTDGISHPIEVFGPAGARGANVTVRIEHTYRGDLVAWLEAPDGSRHPISNREGGSADDLEWSGAIDLEEPGAAIGTWTLRVADHASWDTGVLRFFNVMAF
jgi:subtilisin-like proprotein convertase family protein